MKYLFVVLLVFSCLFSRVSFAGKKISKKELCALRLIHRTEEIEREFALEIKNGVQGPQVRKHTKARTVQDAIKFSKSEAQYLPGTNTIELEKTAMRLGQAYKHSPSTTYFFYRSEKAVGYDMGKETHWIRAEMTSGNEFHGHPMSLERVRKYLPEVRE